jgi:hypothetical protein
VCENRTKLRSAGTSPNPAARGAAPEVVVTPRCYRRAS